MLGNSGGDVVSHDLTSNASKGNRKELFMVKATSKHSKGSDGTMDAYKEDGRETLKHYLEIMKEVAEMTVRILSLKSFWRFFKNG